MGKSKNNYVIFLTIIFVVIVFFALFLYGCPKYNVWQQGLAGQAELAKAEQNRKIAVQEAEAKKESAKALAEADYLEVDYCYYINTYKDIDRYEFGNMFQTEEQAEKALKMVKETLTEFHKEQSNG